MTKLKLYGAPYMRTGRPVYILAELGLEYEHIPTNPREGVSKEYRVFVFYIFRNPKKYI